MVLLRFECYFSNKRSCIISRYHLYFIYMNITELDLPFAILYEHLILISKLFFIWAFAKILYAPKGLVNHDVSSNCVLHLEFSICSQSKIFWFTHTLAVISWPLEKDTPLWWCLLVDICSRIVSFIAVLYSTWV